jgi:hypothetical protein
MADLPADVPADAPAPSHPLLSDSDEEILRRYHARTYSISDGAFLSDLHAVRRRLRAREFAHRRQLEARAGPAAPTFKASALAPGFAIPALGVCLGAPIFRKDDPRKAAIFAAQPMMASAGAGAGAAADSRGDLVVKVIPTARPGAREGIEREVALQTEAHALGLSPAVHGLVHSDTLPCSFLLMERVLGSSLADDEEESADPDYFVDNYPAEAGQVRSILRKLAAASILYPDRTAYNFMRVHAKGTPEAAAPVPRLYVIDFEHATKESSKELCLIEAEAEPIWNEDFK